MANKTIRDFHGSFNVSEAYTTYKSEDQIDEATPPSGPKNPDKPHVGKTAHEKKVERYQQYLAKKKRDREQHLRNNPGLTQNRRQPVSQNAFYSKRAFRNQEINASYDPDLSEASKPEYEVKYSDSKRGPIKVTKFMTQDEAQAFLKKIRGEGMNGIVSKGGKAVRTPMKEDAKSDRLAKIARAAVARKKDQEAQKEKEKEKHYAASKKSRAAIDYLKKGGNKDQFGRVREEEEITESDKAEYDKLMKQIGESLRQRADGAMTFGNRQSAFSTAFYQKHGRKPTKQELRDAGVGKGGDNPAGAKAYQKAMSKLRPASRSGIKDKFVHNEEVEIDEVRKTSSGGEMIKKEKYQKLMKKYGNTPITKVPQKDWHQILTLGDELRAKNLIENDERIDEVRKTSSGGEMIKKEKYQKLMKKYGNTPITKVPKKDWHQILTLGDELRAKNLIENDERIDEAKKGKMGTIAAAARKGMPPYTIVAIQGLNPPKVVAQETTMIASAVPAHVKEMKSKYPKAKISVEGKSGKILHTEQVNAEAGMIGRTKPSRELNVQKFEKKYLGTKSLKDAKRAAHKAERKKGKMDIQKGD